ncbi:hypothetical protein VTO42DRAFT_7527 [Malbranchea cinnamomea]
MPAQNYLSTPLFGGAIRVDLPEGFMDMSRLRQVPDNQEVFASNTTRTNIIIEITERVERSAWETTTDGGTTAPLSPADEDSKAVLYHLNDICEVNQDAYRVLDAPKYHSIPKVAAPALITRALVSTKVRKPRLGSEGEQLVIQEEEATATIHLFVIRLVQRRADILVHVNVPHEELESTGDPNAVVGEESRAQDIMAQMMKTFEILDYGLFAAEE